jgi:hypothetical protein
MAFPTWQQGQENPEVPVNEGFDILAAFSVYGRDPDTTSGLTWGYLGGRWGGIAITPGTLTLTANTTNYVTVARATGAISVSTAVTNWNNATAHGRVFQLVTGPATVTTRQDHRAGPLSIFWPAA